MASFPSHIKDPLNTIAAVFGGLVLGGAAATAAGYGRETLGVGLGLLGLAYYASPRRKFPTSEQVSKGVDLSGKVCLITGPTSGIGINTAKTMALRGARVVLAARNEAKLLKTKKDLEAQLAKRGVKAVFDIIVCDLGDLDSVRSAAKSFLKLGLPLHFLIANAGIMALNERSETKQGFEAQIGVCHLGHALLAKLLLPVMKKSAPSRLIMLSSSAHRFRDTSFVDSPKLESLPYHPWTAYGNAKVSNMMFAKEFHKRYSGEGVSACSVMPGGIHTGLQGEVNIWIKLKWLLVTPFFFKSLEQGAATTIKCAVNQELTGHYGGAYYNDCKCTKATLKFAPDDQCLKLWETTEKLLESASSKL